MTEQEYLNLDISEQSKLISHHIFNWSLCSCTDLEFETWRKQQLDPESYPRFYRLSHRCPKCGYHELLWFSHEIVHMEKILAKLRDEKYFFALSNVPHKWGALPLYIDEKTKTSVHGSGFLGEHVMLIQAICISALKLKGVIE